MALTRDHRHTRPRVLAAITLTGAIDWLCAVTGHRAGCALAKGRFSPLRPFREWGLRVVEGEMERMAFSFAQDIANELLAASLSPVVRPRTKWDA